MKPRKKMKMESLIPQPVEKKLVNSNILSNGLNKFYRDAKIQQYEDKNNPPNSQQSPQKQQNQTDLMPPIKKQIYLGNGKSSKLNVPLSMSINKNEKNAKNHQDSNPEQSSDPKVQYQKEKDLKLANQQKNIEDAKIEQQNRLNHLQQKKQNLQNIDSNDAKKQQKLKAEKLSYKNLYYKKYGKKPEKQHNKQYLQLINQSMTRYDQKLRRLAKEKPKNLQTKKKDKPFLQKYIQTEGKKNILPPVKQSQKQSIEQEDQLGQLGQLDQLDHMEVQDNFIEMPLTNNEHNNPIEAYITNNDSINVVQSQQNQIQQDQQRIDDRLNHDMPQLPQFQEISNILEDKQQNQIANTSNYMHILYQPRVEESNINIQPPVLTKIESQIPNAAPKNPEIKDIIIQQQSTIPFQIEQLEYSIFTHQKIQSFDIIKQQRIPNKRLSQLEAQNKPIQQKQQHIIISKSPIAQQPETKKYPLQKKPDIIQQQVRTLKTSIVADDYQKQRQTIIDDNGIIIDVANVEIRDFGYCNFLIVLQQSQELAITSMN